MSDFQKLKFSDMAYQITTKVNPAETNLDYYVGLEHIDPESLHIKRWGIPTDVKGEKIIVSKGDIIFGKRRAYQRKVAIAEFDCICSAHSMILRPKEDKILNKIFPFFLQSDQFMERAVQISVGGLSPTINWRDLAEQEFLIPKKDAQRHIAEILWAAEDVIVKNEHFVAEVEHYKQLMMCELFHKGIGHTEFKEIKKIGLVPKEWSICKLSEIGSVKTGPFGAQLHQKDYKESGTPIITVEHLGDKGIVHQKLPYVSDEDKKRLNQYILTEGDIVFSRVGSVDRSCLVSKKEEGWLFSGRLLRVRADKEKILPEFLRSYFHNEDFKNFMGRIAVGGLMPSLNTSLLSGVTVPLPLIEEQQQIASILTSIDNTINAACNTIESSKSLKMKLINTLLSPAEGDEH